jgi:hypothetical protein
MDSFYILLSSDRIYRINWILFVWITFLKKVIQHNPPAAEESIGFFLECT